MNIHGLAHAGDAEGVAHELRSGVPADLLDEQEWLTPLMWAARSHEAGLDVIQLLIEHGADPNLAGGEPPRTPLQLASRALKLDCVEALLNSGATVTYEQMGNPMDFTDPAELRAVGNLEKSFAISDLLLKQCASNFEMPVHKDPELWEAAAYDKFDVVRQLVETGHELDEVKWDDLMYSTACGSLDDLQRALDRGDDITATDRWNRTPLLLAAIAGDVEKAKALHAHGARLDVRCRHTMTPLMHAAEHNRLAVVQWLIEQGVEIDTRDRTDDTALMAALEHNALECAKALLAAGASIHLVDHINENAMAHANSIDMVRLLQSAGADLNDMNDEMRALLTGVQFESDLVCTREEYVEGKYRRFGVANPEPMNVPFWRAMVKCGAVAYRGEENFEMDRPVDDDPIWCFHRFGKSINELPDGRFIEIGGEHEDFYDTDFCIYNDVIVHRPGGGFDIYGYPEDVFPPTDFHSSTYVDGQIYIIGGLRYYGQRAFGTTTVYRLCCETLRIETIETRGDKPGWIHGHKAMLVGPRLIRVTGGEISTMGDEKEISTPNTTPFVLDISTRMWRRE